MGSQLITSAKILNKTDASAFYSTRALFSFCCRLLNHVVAFKVVRLESVTIFQSILILNTNHNSTPVDCFLSRNQIKSGVLYDFYGFYIPNLGELLVVL